MTSLPLLYTSADLVDWYAWIDPAEDHASEVAAMRAALEGAATGPLHTLLELGAGAGNNASHLASLKCTLADLSPAMLALSARRNPGAEHVVGDMRTLRLGRQFDAVLIHDAIQYMTTEDDLRAAVTTAFLHTRPGGAAVFAPDALADSFHEMTTPLAHDAAGRSMRGLEWCYDPDPADTTFRVEYAFLLREGEDVRAFHDRHLEGLFPRATWVALLAGAGYQVSTFLRPLDEEDATDEVFVCRRPEAG